MVLYEIVRRTNHIKLGVRDMQLNPELRRVGFPFAAWRIARDINSGRSMEDWNRHVMRLMY